jgi:hypothetical protein
MLTRALGVDIQAIFMTMLALVGVYLVVTNASAINALVRTVAAAGTDSLIILQGRSPRKVR